LFVVFRVCCVFVLQLFGAHYLFWLAAMSEETNLAVRFVSRDYAVIGWQSSHHYGLEQLLWQA
jgi:hypothetical protein